MNPGDRFGHLAFIRYVLREGKSQRHSYALCKCDCGRHTEVFPANLRHGFTRTCGHSECPLHKTLREAVAKNQRKEHAQHAGRELYGYWYLHFRAGSVPRWRDYVAFEGDVSNDRAHSKQTLRAKDKSRPVGPDNFLWEHPHATYITHDGETMTISGWARQAGITREGMRRRLVRGGDIHQVLKAKRGDLITDAVWPDVAAWEEELSELKTLLSNLKFARFVTAQEANCLTLKIKYWKNKSDRNANIALYPPHPMTLGE